MSLKKVCPDRSNCPGWIQGYGCEFCEFKPFPDFITIDGQKYPIRVNENGEHYVNINFTNYRIPWYDDLSRRL